MRTIAPLGAALLAGAAHAQIGFQNVTTDLGLDGYIATTGDAHGPGLVFCDLSNDGYPDLYLTHNGANRLYLNVDDGSGGRTFQLLTGTGAEDTGPATGAIAGDYDNDGDLDLFVANFDAPNVMLRNMLVEGGVLIFLDATNATDPTPGTPDSQMGVGDAVWEGIALDNTLSAAWADPDKDGDLDLYVGNHNAFFGSAAIEGPLSIAGRRDVFYINNGDRSFTDMTMPLGVPGWVDSDSVTTQTANQRFSSTNAVIFADLNNDTWVDLLVTNKVGGPDDTDHLYLNLGLDENQQWRGFVNATYLISPVFGRESGGAMGVDVADYDHDGDLDFYITDWSNPNTPSVGSNDMWVNQLMETGTISFVHQNIPEARYSWGTRFEDFDNDGWEDLHVATQTGFRDYFYRNAEGVFVETATASGVDQSKNSRGVATADFDLDGFADMFVCNLWNESVFYRNTSGDTGESANNNWIALKLVGDPLRYGRERSSRDAIGARAYAFADLDGSGEIDDDEMMIREVVSGHSNAVCTSSLELEFGIGAAPGAFVLVVWPSGATSEHTVLAGERPVLLEPAACIGDVTTSGAGVGEPGFGEPDGTVTAADLQHFINTWVQQLASADITTVNVTPPDPRVGFPDGQVTVADLNFFVNQWIAGCP